MIGPTSTKIISFPSLIFLDFYGILIFGSDFLLDGPTILSNNRRFSIRRYIQRTLSVKCSTGWLTSSVVYNQYTFRRTGFWLKSDRQTAVSPLSKLLPVPYCFQHMICWQCRLFALSIFYHCKGLSRSQNMALLPLRSLGFCEELSSSSLYLVAAAGSNINNDTIDPWALMNWLRSLILIKFWYLRKEQNRSHSRRWEIYNENSYMEVSKFSLSFKLRHISKNSSGGCLLLDGDHELVVLETKRLTEGMIDFLR